MPCSLDSTVGALGIDCTEQVQDGHDQTQDRGHHELLVELTVSPISHSHQEHDGRDQVEDEGNRVVDQFVNGFGNDAAGAERDEAGQQEAEGANQEGGGHQQEEQFGRVMGVGEKKPVPIVGHDSNSNGSKDLQE